NIPEIGKNDSFQRRPYREPPLQASLQKLHASYRISLGIKRPKLLVRVASDRVSTTQKKPFENRDLCSALKGLDATVSYSRCQRAEVQYRNISPAIQGELEVINLRAEKRTGPFHILQNAPAVFGIQYGIDPVPGGAGNE